MAYSAGFSPHPKISYANAAPTGTASEAEYVEIAVIERLEPGKLRELLDDSLPPGLDIVEVVEARTTGFAERLEASRWRIEFPGLETATIDQAAAALWAAAEAPVERTTKSGRRTIDARAAVVAIEVSECAILRVVVRQVTPTVRPDDILTALRAVAGLNPVAPAMVTREAQGPLRADGITIDDPFDPDRENSAEAVVPTGAPPDTQT
jgi:radical SAM-linked protein